MVGYLFMVLACFVVICRVSRDGTNVAIEDLAGLHRRSPLLAATLAGRRVRARGHPAVRRVHGQARLLKAALAQGTWRSSSSP
jgi:NADH-quinone oxidoreductase subunit N